MSRVCSMADPRDLFGAMMKFASQSAEPDEEEEPSQPGEPRWMRGKPMKASSPRQAGGGTPSRERPSRIRPRSFGAAGAYVGGNVVDGPPRSPEEKAKMVSFCEMPCKEEDPKKAWKLTIPAGFFAEAEEWGLLRDVRVRFEPDRIVVEAHDRLGNSKIIEWSNLPRRLDTESSTYKLNPDGKDVQLNIQTVKSPRPLKEMLAAEKGTNKTNEDGLYDEKDLVSQEGKDPSQIIALPQKLAREPYGGIPTKASEFL